MPDANILQVIEQAAHELLVWVGFGTLVGLAAKAIMPGRDPGGTIGTLMMGIGGSVIGCGLLVLIDSSYRVTPISPMGFVAGTGGAFVILLFFRILSNSYVVEAQDGERPIGTGVTTVQYFRRRKRRAA
ncbi:MAG: transglycosylase [Planctomycetales bacterium 12-60-4]|nr:MAG: transglycosylase [Planctomycetales bacterium 12-60-4]